MRKKNRHKPRCFKNRARTMRREIFKYIATQNDVLSRRLTRHEVDMTNLDIKIFKRDNLHFLENQDLKKQVKVLRNRLFTAIWFFAAMNFIQCAVKILG